MNSKRKTDDQFQEYYYFLNNQINFEEKGEFKSLRSAYVAAHNKNDTPALSKKYYYNARLNCIVSPNEMEKLINEGEKLSNFTAYKLGGLCSLNRHKNKEKPRNRYANSSHPARTQYYFNDNFEIVSDSEGEMKNFKIKELVPVCNFLANSSRNQSLTQEQVKKFKTAANTKYIFDTEKNEIIFNKDIPGENQKEMKLSGIRARVYEINKKLSNSSVEAKKNVNEKSMQASKGYKENNLFPQKNNSEKLPIPYKKSKDEINSNTDIIKNIEEVVNKALEDPTLLEELKVLRN